MFSTVMQGWIDRLEVWDRARKAAQAIDKAAMPAARALADLEEERNRFEVSAYKDEMVRNLSLILRWMAEDPFQHDTFAAIITGAVSDAFEPVIRRQWSDLEGLQKKVGELEEKLNLLLKPRENADGGVLLEGTEDRGQGSGEAPRDPCGCGVHAATGGGRQDP